MNGTKLMRGYLSNSFFSSRLAMYPGRALAAVMRLALEEKGETNGCVDVMRDATQCHDNVHTSQFYLAVLIGMCEPWYGLLNVCLCAGMCSDEVC